MVPATVSWGRGPVFRRSGCLSDILGRNVERPGILLRFKLFLLRPGLDLGHAVTDTANR